MNTTCSVIEVIDQFIGEQSICHQSCRTYRAALINFFSFLTGSDQWNPGRNDEVRNITTTMIIDYKNDLNARHKSECSVLLYIAVIKRFFIWTTSKGIHDNVALGVKGPKMHQGLRKDPLTLEQAIALLKSVDRSTLLGKRNYAIVCLLMFNGLRVIEVSRINNNDIVLENGRRSLYIQGKGHVNKDDKVTLEDVVFDAIHEYQLTKVGYEPDDPLFLSHNRENFDNRLNERTITSIVFKLLTALGYKTDRITTHSLRHTAASIAIDNGMSITDIKAFMRHSSHLVTEIYIQQIMNKKKYDNQVSKLLTSMMLPELSVEATQL